MTSSKATGYQFHIDTDSLSGDGTPGNPVRAITQGGYRGAWSPGGAPYQAGSIVRRGPWVWGARVSTSQDPSVAEGDMNLSADWIPRGNASQGGQHLLTLSPSGQTFQNAIGYRNTIGSLSSDWRNRRLVIDALVGPSGGADYFNFGIIDPAVPLSTMPGSPGGMCGTTGCWGVNVDFGGNRVGAVVNGVATAYTAYTAAAVGAGNDILETSVLYRFRLDLTEAAPNWTITLYRDDYIRDAMTPWAQSYVGSWTVTAPTFTQWRWVVGSTSGGVSGNVAVRCPFTQMVPGAGDWDMISEFPHTPHQDPYALFGVTYGGS
jgi:hypothetical protein